MNHIEVKRIKTCYDYPEHYWVIDGTPITFYLDRHRPSGYSSLLGLMPAWNGELLSQWENDFVWEMVDSQEELNVPVLVCEDDQDLSCYNFDQGKILQEYAQVMHRLIQQFRYPRRIRR